MISPIERIDRLDPEVFLRRHLVPRRPVIVTQAIHDWPALTRWTPARFAALFGELEVELQGQSFEVQRVMRLRDYVAALDELATHTDVPYLRWSDAHEGFTARAFERLADEWSRPHFLPERGYIQPLELRRSQPNRRRYPASGICLSPRGAITKLHVDRGRSNAVLAQIHGRKCCYLVSPEQRQRVDLRRWTAHALGSPAQRRAFEQLDVLEARLEPGEVLFIPNQWLHEVYTTDTSISLTYNFVHMVEARHWIPYAAFDTMIIQLLERASAAAQRFQDDTRWP